jgi:hypothetical protein
MTTPHTNCPSCGGPLDRTATECSRCGTPIVKTGGEQATQAVQNVASAGTGMKSTTAAALVHVSILGSFLLGCFSWPLIPILIGFMKKDDPFVTAHLKEQWNLQVIMIPIVIIGTLLSFFIIGIPILLAAIVYSIVFPIKAAIAASNGETYSYPWVPKIFK